MIWHSWWFFSFLFFVVAVVAYNFWMGSRKVGALPLSTLHLAKNINGTLRGKLRHLPDILKALALILIVVALARPQKTDEKVQRNVEGIDIMMALDISHSMLIEDMKPNNRLEASKQTIRNFVDKRISDRIGLVVFSGESYTRVPLTLDYPVLRENLAQVQTSNNIKMGTAIGVALGNAVSRLKDSVAKSRVVILLTDGENNTGLIDPQTALKIAKGYGIRIYTIGAGKDGQAQLPIYSTDVFGRKRKRYQPIHSKVNVELLTQLASETGGKFYRAADTAALESVFKDIDTLEKTKIEVNKYTKYTELFYKYLFWAFICYLSALFLQITIFRRGVS